MVVFLLIFFRALKQFLRWQSYRRRLLSYSLCYLKVFCFLVAVIIRNGPNIVQLMPILHLINIRYLLYTSFIIVCSFLYIRQLMSLGRLSLNLSHMFGVRRADQIPALL